MSHPSPRLPSHSERFGLTTSPVQNQSHIFTSPKSPQSILNQKLIPRNYLNNGIKSSTIPDGVASENAYMNGPRPADLRSKVSNVSLGGSGIDARSISQSTTATDLGRSGQASPESDTLGYEDLKVSRTNRTVESPTIPLYHGFAKPDSPTLHFELASVDPNMPRTSSIDSAISTVSNTSIHKAAGDIRSLSPTSVRNLIATAGGAENLIAHLLKEKNNATSQNAQLWRLVEKQRALLLGLNKDLERITKERDRYKKKAKDSQQSNVGEKGQRGSLSPTKSAGQTTPKALSKPVVSGNETIIPHAVQAQRPARGEQVAGTDVNHPTPEERRPAHVNTDHDLTDHPTFALTVATPDKPGRTMTSSRKAPPKPLNLVRPNDAINTPRHQDSAASELTEFEEEPERGRRRTREDDDRERELSAIQAEEARSKSKKQEKMAKAARAASATSGVSATSTVSEHKAHAKVTAVSLSPPGLPLSPRPQHAQTFLSQNPSQAAASLNERMLAGALKSPGLPLSPRPMHNTGSAGVSLPMSPRANISNPLSPRAPKQPIPIPMNPAAPIDPAALQATHYKVLPQAQSPPFAAGMDIDRLRVHKPPTSEAPSVFRGLMEPQYPNLLLPPNALPSIQIKVASSRAKPSRHSMLGFKVQEDAIVFSLSVISRSSNNELWRIDKIPSTLAHLEQSLRPRCAELPRLPDKKLFQGQPSPASLDARRKAMDDYFEELLDTPLDEQAGLYICSFLSTDVIDPDTGGGSRSASVTTTTAELISNNGQRALKTGYLFKKGKNFGHWKTRYFVLDGAELRYYEDLNGSHLGTIRLQKAHVGRPKPDESLPDDADGQFRHAFLIQEPKRKDSTAYLRHVLCAESDVERDEWVRVLTGHSDGGASDVQSRAEYDAQTVKSASSIRDTASIKDMASASPTPTSGSSNAESPALESLRDVRSPASTISGPMNGSVITNTSTWGNKAPPTPGLPRDTKDKPSKMSNIFGFKKTEGHAGPVAEPKSPRAPPPRILRHNGYVRPVFGLPLAEAVEYCAPFNVEIHLPAVVYRSIEYLRHQNAAQEEGLFRLSGSNTTIRLLRERFNTEGDVDLVADDEYHDVHAVTSLFKSYLRELPSTLLTRELHLEFVRVLELTNSADKVAAFNVLVHRLPYPNFVLLKELSLFLLEVTQSADKNKMSVRNMGIVFSPTLNIPTPVFTLFLTEYHAIFEQNDTSRSTNIHTTEVQAHNLAPTDIRSPRHQMFSDLPTPAYHQSQFPGLPSNPHDHNAPPANDAGAFGFVPVQHSYESGNYVSQLPGGNVYPAAGQAITQVTMGDQGGFSSLNSLLAPNQAPSTRAQRRESAMMFASQAPR